MHNIMKGLVIMRLEIDNGEITNYSTIETFINSASIDDVTELKSLLTEIKIRLNDNSTNHLHLALLVDSILNKCNELGIGIEGTSIGTNKKNQAKRLHLSNLPSSFTNDRAGKANVTLIIAGILTTAIMYVILLLGYIIKNF